MVGLKEMIVGGVGVENEVREYIEGKRGVIENLK